VLLIPGLNQDDPQGVRVSWPIQLTPADVQRAPTGERTSNARIVKTGAIIGVYDDFPGVGVWDYRLRWPSGDAGAWGPWASIEVPTPPTPPTPETCTDWVTLGQPWAFGWSYNGEGSGNHTPTTEALNSRVTDSLGAGVQPVVAFFGGVSTVHVGVLNTADDTSPSFDASIFAGVEVREGASSYRITGDETVVSVQLVFRRTRVTINAVATTLASTNPDARVCTPAPAVSCVGRRQVS